MNSPYMEIYNGKNAVMVQGNTEKGWIKGISTLIDDPILRFQIAGEARKTVEEYFDIEKEAYRWPQTYKEAMELKKNGANRNSTNNAVFA